MESNSYTKVKVIFIYDVLSKNLVSLNSNMKATLCARVGLETPVSKNFLISFFNEEVKGLIPFSSSFQHPHDIENGKSAQKDDPDPGVNPEPQPGSGIIRHLFSGNYFVIQNG